MTRYGNVAPGKDLTAGQYGDSVGEVCDDAQIVLHHQDGPVGGDALDERQDSVGTGSDPSLQKADRAAGGPRPSVFL
jgi:hypothetical protein